MKLISVMQNGRRVDIPIEKFQKMLEETKESMEKVEKKDKEAV
jgi:hypothetical protein